MTASEPDPLDRRTPEPARPAASRAGRALALAIVAFTGLTASSLLVASDRVDTAALFVGVPLVLAVAVALSPPARSLHGLTFRVVTFGLLITSAYLHEGAACVLMAAPLVYGVAHFVVELVHHARQTGHRRRAALAFLPLLLVAGLEGTAYRIDPVQTVATERVVALPLAEVEQKLARGPDFSAARPLLLRATGYPTPTMATGNGLTVGTRWTLTMAGGPIVTEVVARDGRRIEFAVVSDESKTVRWLRLQGAVVHLSPRDDGGTAVRLELSFTRRLDPSWYFGPIEAAMVGAGLDHFADALGLTEAPGRD